MTRSSVAAMLDRHRTVFVKPVSGMHGKGVIRLEWVKDEEKPFRFQEGTKKRSFRELDSLYDAVREVAAGRSYLVQKGIRLLRYKGRPFDIRVMVQQNPAGKWETTGMLGRVAQPGKIVTNVHNGGKLELVETLLRPYVPADRMGSTVAQLKNLGLRVAEHLGRKFPGIREIGLDVGIGSDLWPWIIEVNTSPASFIFKRMPDKSVYRRVRAYAIAYGKLRRKRKDAGRSAGADKKGASSSRAASKKKRTVKLMRPPLSNKRTVGELRRR